MDRREALKRIGIGGVTIAGASAVTSSTAFADGGSAACRPTATGPTNNLTAGTPSKRAISVTSSAAGGGASFTINAASCPCSGWTSTVQRKWSVSSTDTGNTYAIYSGLTGGTPISGPFGAAGSTVTVGSPVYVRDTAGNTLNAATYTVDLTIRHICTSPTGVRSWSCLRYRMVVVWNTSGPNGTITSQSTTTVGPPDNSSFCNDGTL